MPLGENLIKKGQLSAEQLEKALGAQTAEPGSRLGEILVKLGFVNKEQVEAAL